MDKKPRVGVFALESLTTGMYTEPLDTIREYIQNATDSICEAIRTNLIKKDEGRIEIFLNDKNRSITLKDNGTGIPEEIVFDRLRNIGMSDKNISEDAGFRGIGRLAGIAYCNILKFVTSTKGSNVESTVEFNCKNIRSLIRPKEKVDQELVDILNNNTKCYTGNCDGDNHFFKVEMIDISKNEEKFFNHAYIEQYITQIAPLKYNFNKFPYSKMIDDLITKYNFNIPTITTILKSHEYEKPLFKQYRNTYRTKKTKHGEFNINITNIEFYPKEITKDSKYWLWYGISKLPGQIEDDLSAGLRFRKNNIQIGGPERVEELFKEIAESNKRFNRYFIGEIHILNNNVIPNARRDGFESDDNWFAIKSDIMQFILERCNDVRASSDVRNIALEKITFKAKQIIEEVDWRLEDGLVSKEEKEGLQKQVDKQIIILQKKVKIDDNVNTQQKLNPLIDTLDKHQKELISVKSYAAKKLKSDLSKKERIIIDNILKILSEVLDKDNFKIVKEAIMKEYGMNN